MRRPTWWCFQATALPCSLPPTSPVNRATNCASKLVPRALRPAPLPAQLYDFCALLRLAQVVGALDAALTLSIDHACERKQFGRAIGQFQAVQQQLALFGAEAAAVACAVRAAFRAATCG